MECLPHAAENTKAARANSVVVKRTAFLYSRLSLSLSGTVLPATARF
jgi:hypothetical protein